MKIKEYFNNANKNCDDMPRRTKKVRYEDAEINNLELLKKPEPTSTT